MEIPLMTKQRLPILRYPRPAWKACQPGIVLPFRSDLPLESNQKGVFRSSGVYYWPTGGDYGNAPIRKAPWVNSRPLLQHSRHSREPIARVSQLTIAVLLKDSPDTVWGVEQSPFGPLVMLQIPLQSKGTCEVFEAHHVMALERDLVVGKVKSSPRQTRLLKRPTPRGPLRSRDLVELPLVAEVCDNLLLTNCFGNWNVLRSAERQARQPVAWVFGADSDDAEFCVAVDLVHPLHLTHLVSRVILSDAVSVNPDVAEAKLDGGPHGILDDWRKVVRQMRVSVLVRRRDSPHVAQRYVAIPSAWIRVDNQTGFAVYELEVRKSLPIRAGTTCVVMTLA